MVVTMTQIIQSYVYMCYQPGDSMAMLPPAYRGKLFALTNRYTQISNT